MTKSDAELLSDIVAVFSTAIVETTRAIARNSGGSVSRHLIATDIQKHADKLPETHATAKAILGNIAAGLGDKPFTPIVFSVRKAAHPARPTSTRHK